MTYEVQHYTTAYGWINTWLYDEGHGLQPETFVTREAAEAALNEHVEDLVEEFFAGHTRPYDHGDFRVRQVGTAIQPSTGEQP